MDNKVDYFKMLGLLNPDQFLTGNNFAKKADFIYAEAVSLSDFEKMDKTNLEFSIIESHIVIYSKKNIKLFENDVIYCKTDFLLELFSKLYLVKTLSNIKLVTHQAATPWIDEKLYSLKPDCISEWYSINTNLKKENLIAIPLGIANNFSKPNLHAKDFINFYSKQTNTSKLNKIYCNFRVNTNPVRASYLKNMESNNDCIIDEPNLTKTKYLEKLNKYNYIFCPEGLGIDTHRFWETFYAGSIPVSKKQMIYRSYEKYFEEFIPSKNINIESFRDINFDRNLAEILNIDYWNSLIRKNIVNSNNLPVTVNDSPVSKKIEKSISKKYTLYKIQKSDLDLFKRLKFTLKCIFNFDKDLEKRFWYQVTDI